MIRLLRPALSFALIAAGTVAMMHAGTHLFLADTITWTGPGLVVLGNALFRAGLALERFKAQEAPRV